MRNFGAIFAGKSNMKKLVFIFLIFLAGDLLARVQDNLISGFDLYGCWIFERSENGERPEKWIYKRCEESDSKIAIRRSRISLLAFSKSEIQRDSPVFCGTTYTDEGTWSFDTTNEIVTIYYAQKFLEELKEKDPEEYTKFGSPERLEWTKFKVVGLSETQMEIEKTTHNKTSYNPSRRPEFYRD